METEFLKFIYIIKLGDSDEKKEEIYIRTKDNYLT